MSLLDLDDVSVELGGRRVVDGATLSVDRGEVVALLGPNGAGKTTLLRAALGLTRHRGTTSLTLLRYEDRSRHFAWMPQDRTIAWPVTAEALVTLGRLPHGGGAGPTRPQDRAAIDEAFRRTGLDHLRRRVATELSGGERARLLVARLIAQQSPLILADEPIAGLDPAAQIATMRLLQDLAAEGRGVILSLHDLGLALRHCTRAILMSRGQIVADGPPRDVLSDANVANVFGIRVHRQESADGAILQAVGTL